MVPEVAGQAQTEALWAAAGLGEHSARALFLVTGSCHRRTLGREVASFLLC